MNKRYDIYGDAECTTILGVSPETLGHGLTIQMTVQHNLHVLSRHTYMKITHLCASRQLPVEMIAPLLMIFLSNVDSDEVTIFVDDNTRSIWAMDAFRDKTGNLKEIDYHTDRPNNEVIIDSTYWKQWMVDNGVEFVCFKDVEKEVVNA